MGHVPEVPLHPRAARACQPQNVPRVCFHHFRMTSAERLASVLDAESFECWFETEGADVPETDPLDFPVIWTKSAACERRACARACAAACGSHRGHARVRLA